MTDVTLGHATIPLFAIDKGYRNFNNGSFGSTPREVLKAQSDFRDVAEARPDPWFRGAYQEHWNKARDVVADFINADHDDVALVENASTAVNTVLRSLQFKEGDAILIFNTSYPMVKNICTWLQETIGVKIIVVDLPHVFSSDEDFVTALNTTQSQTQANIKIAIIDHIVSVPHVIVPIQKLTQICKSHGVNKVMIDGAHVLGQIPLDITLLSSFGIDYYTSNAHKWFFSPKGSAIFWVSKESQNNIIPLVVSSEWHNQRHSFSGRFRYTGTRDFTSVLSIKSAHDFYMKMGGTKIMTYLHSLVEFAAQFLVELWGTELMCPVSMSGSMLQIRLPIDDINIGNELHQKLYEKYGIYMIVLHINNKCWTRLSAQIYLEREDFEVLGHRVIEILKEIKPTTTTTTTSTEVKETAATSSTKE